MIEALVMTTLLAAQPAALMDGNGLTVAEPLPWDGPMPWMSEQDFGPVCPMGCWICFQLCMDSCGSGGPPRPHCYTRCLSQCDQICNDC